MAEHRVELMEFRYAAHDDFHRHADFLGQVKLLFLRELDEVHRVARHADRQLRVLFRIGDGIFQGLTAQHVDVEVLATFDDRLQLDGHFAIFDLAQGRDSHRLILDIVSFGAQATGFLLAFIQQPEGVQQNVIGR